MIRYICINPINFLLLSDFLRSTFSKGMLMLYKIEAIRGIRNNNSYFEFSPSANPSNLQWDMRLGWRNGEIQIDVIKSNAKRLN